MRKTDAAERISRQARTSFFSVIRSFFEDRRPVVPAQPRRLKVETFESRCLLAGVTSSLATEGEGLPPTVEIVVEHEVANLCKEKDNAHFLGTIPQGGTALTNFSIYSFPTPSDPTTVEDEGADFDDCTGFSNDPPPNPGEIERFDFIDGDVTVQAVREPNFWRPGMTVDIEGNTLHNITYVAWFQKLSATDTRTVFVMYADGSTRHASLPLAAQHANGFGASVIVGPVETIQLPSGETRAYADVDDLKIADIATRSQDVTYNSGEAATLTISEITSQRSRVDVVANYTANEMFRIIAMHVAEPKGDVESDVNLVATRDDTGVDIAHVDDFAGATDVSEIYVFPAVNTEHAAWSGGVSVVLGEVSQLGHTQLIEGETLIGDGGLSHRALASGNGVTNSHIAKIVKRATPATGTFTPRVTGFYSLKPRISRGEFTDTTAEIMFAGQTSQVAVPSTFRTGELISDAWDNFVYTTETPPVFLTAGTQYNLSVSIPGSAPNDNGFELDVLAAILVDRSPAVTSVLRESPADAATNADSLEWTVNVNEPVTNVDTGDFTVTGGSTAIVSGVTMVNSQQYRVTVNGGDLATFSGPVLLDINGNNTITDTLGFPLDSAADYPSEQFDLDNIQPTATSIRRQAPATETTEEDTLTFRTTFSEDVTGVDIGDFVATGTTAAVTGVVAVNGKEYDVTIGGGNLPDIFGVVGLDLSTVVDITDTVGNQLDPAEPTTDETYSVENNVAPTMVNISSDTVAENSADNNRTTVGTLTAVDPNVDDTHTFELVTGLGDDDNDLFEIVEDTLRVRAGTPLDFETDDTLRVRVRATDAASNMFEQQLVIRITDVNERPTSIQIDNASIDENATLFPIAIGMLMASDVDAGDSHTFMLVNGAGDTHNTMFQITGDILEFIGPNTPDFETQPVYSIRVQARDSGGLTLATQLQINVEDVNEAPTDLMLSKETIERDVPGAIGGTITVTDPEAGDTHTLSVDDTRFEVVNNQLKLKSGVSLSATDTSITLNITARDQGGAGSTFTEMFELTVVDANSPPVFRSDAVADQAAVVNTPFSYTIDADAATDPDAGDVVTYAATNLQGGSLPDWLDFSTTTLEFFGTPSLADVGVWEVELTATDNSGASDSDDFSITVQTTALAWHNAPMPGDVEGSGTVTLLDVLTIVRYISQNGEGELPPSTGETPPYVDVNADNSVTTADAIEAIRIINEARANQGGQEGEGDDVAGSSNQRVALPIELQSATENLTSIRLGDITVVGETNAREAVFAEVADEDDSQSHLVTSNAADQLALDLLAEESNGETQV